MPNESDQPPVRRADGASDLYLKRSEERRLRAGHVWVYSNEIDTRRTPLGDFKAGDAVNVRASNGAVLGCGYVNPHALLCARLVTTIADGWPDPELLRRRLGMALSLRERRYSEPYYRLCFGEADGLPGLVVDRYGDVLVGQLTTAGMDRQRAAVGDALRDLLKPRALYWQNAGAAREREGLEADGAAGFGKVPDRVTVEEQGLRFSAPLAQGQKTGWFYDQAINRERFVPYLTGRLLDVCSYVGAWGVLAASRGATVTCLDSSALALEYVARNADTNGLDVATRKSDAFDGLKALRAEEATFDTIVLDPPAFIKRRRDERKGREAYRRLNTLALRLIEEEGILVSCSCSQPLEVQQLIREIQAAARAAGRFVQVLEIGTQGPDHPLHPAIPEMAYLKVVVCRVTSRGDLP